MWNAVAAALSLCVCASLFGRDIERLRGRPELRLTQTAFGTGGGLFAALPLLLGG